MKKKKVIKAGIALLLTASVVAGGFLLLGAGRSDKELPPIEREYKVSVGDITVGMDSGGKISIPGVNHSFLKNTVIDKVLVKAGDTIKKGDQIAKLSIEQTEKNRKSYQERYDELEEELEDIKEDKQDYLTDLSWSLENEKDDNIDSYWDRYYEIENERWALEDELSQAEWKKNNWSDDELIDSAIAKLEEEIAEKKSQLEKHKEDREKQKEQENNLKYQKEQQDKKVSEFDKKIKSLQKEQDSVNKRLKAAKSGVLLSSINGIVLKVNYSSGQSVDDGKPVAVVGNTEKLLLNLTVESENIVDVKKGQKVVFYADAYPDQAVNGTVKERILIPDSDGKFGAVVEVEKTELELLNGMTASAVIVLKQKQNILTLQNKAIKSENGKQYVDIRTADGTLARTEITTGFSDGNVSEILSGLKDGDTVIYTSTDKISLDDQSDAGMGEMKSFGSISLGG